MNPIRPKPRKIRLNSLAYAHLQGYDGEWRHVSQQLIALAEATLAEKFARHPTPGVRSTTEVYMHISNGEFLSAQRYRHQEACGTSKKATSKAEVINWLKRSLDAVKDAHLAVSVEPAST